MSLGKLVVGRFKDKIDKMPYSEAKEKERLEMLQHFYYVVGFELRKGGSDYFNIVQQIEHAYEQLGHDLDELEG